MIPTVISFQLSLIMLITYQINCSHHRQHNYKRDVINKPNIGVGIGTIGKVSRPAVKRFHGKDGI